LVEGWRDAASRRSALDGLNRFCEAVAAGRAAVLSIAQVGVIAAVQKPEPDLVYAAQEYVQTGSPFAAVSLIEPLSAHMVFNGELRRRFLPPDLARATEASVARSVVAMAGFMLAEADTTQREIGEFRARKSRSPADA
jgi:hypothetical protein